MVDQVRHQLEGLPSREGATIVVEGAKNHLDRDLFQGFVEAVSDLLADIEEHEVEEEGGIELELDAIGRGFPEIGEIEHAFGDQEGIFNTPAAPIQAHRLPRGEARGIEDVGEVAIPLPAPQHRDQA